MSLRKENEIKHPCYTVKEGVPTLYVTLVNGEEYLFPYIHFQSAHLLMDDEDSLTIDFASHQITAHGTGLRKLFRALQMMSVDWLGDHFSTQTNSQCKIERICVEAQTSSSDPK